MRPSLVEIYLSKFQTMLMNSDRVQNIALQNELPITQLSSFLNFCRQMHIGLNDFESVIQRIIRWVIAGANERLPTRELKKPLLFLRELSDLFKSMKVQTDEQAMCIVLSNSTKVHLTTADFTSFLEACKGIGIGLDGFELMIQLIYDQVIDGVDDHLPTREFKYHLLFLLELGSLFKNISFYNELKFVRKNNINAI